MNSIEHTRVLFELYKFKVDEMNLEHVGRIKLINVFIDEFIKFEEYETASFFKCEKNKIYKSYRLSRRKMSFRLIYRFIRYKIYN